MNTQPKNPLDSIEDELSINTAKYASFLANLSYETKKWYALAIVGAVASDGMIENEEMQFLRVAIGFLEEKEDIQTLLQYAKERKIPKLSQLRNISRTDAFRLIIALGKIIIDDDKMAAAEAEYLKGVAGKLGFTETFKASYINYLKDCIDQSIQKKITAKKDELLKNDLEKIMKLAFNNDLIYT